MPAMSSSMSTTSRPVDAEADHVDPAAVELVPDPGELAELGGAYEHERATALFVDAARVRDELGDYVGLAECFEGPAESLAAEGRISDATRMRAAAGQSARSMAPAQRDGRTHPPTRSSIDEAVRLALAVSRTPGPSTAAT